jgi:aspartate/glutamate racemase
MVRIGCFHAHYSNIEHIDNALRGLDVELIHYVDPGLDRIKLDADFTTEMAQKKVLDTLNWIAKSHVDAILMTCTFFTAIYDEDIHRFPIPIIKIDDPLFEEICQLDQPTIVAFTNPSTVQGTMNQLAITL